MKLNKHLTSARQDLFWALYSISISYNQITEGNSSATKFLKYTEIGDDETYEVAFPREFEKNTKPHGWMILD